MADILPPPTTPRDPYLRLLKRLFEIHATDTGGGTCPNCNEPEPCDTMRAVWIYDLERRVGVSD